MRGREGGREASNRYGACMAEGKGRRRPPARTLIRPGQILPRTYMVDIGRRREKGGFWSCCGEEEGK